MEKIVNYDIQKIEVDKGNNDFEIVIDEKEISTGIIAYSIQITFDQPAEPKPLSLKWRFPAKNIKGVWKTGALYDKRLHADWELEPSISRVSIDAPVISIFGHDDINCHTFACADALNTVEMNASLREEDNEIYCYVKLFSERHPAIQKYHTEIIIDKRKIHFSEVLTNISNWWSSFPNLKPMEVPKAAFYPVYSTWYAYHQNLAIASLLSECRLASEMGYKTIIVDDGWQTNDNNRGYDYTGDWQPERIPEMREFVEQIHAMGMKFLIWYSVPFCGKKSKAYQRFKGKFLTENHRWAPVFDPRYPEVRKYLINIYADALKHWGLDGFKLDFIDDFKVYPDTSLTKAEGRDFDSVNEAVDQLMSDVKDTLTAIKPDIIIEFRQKYIGPYMRKYGNMFRAFDCPNDSSTNRIRTTDVRLLSGNTSVHSDMFTWHYDESVEISALQFLNVIFSVPQVSVRLNEITEDHKKMIAFYTEYWVNNKDVLMQGNFKPYKPLSNYPLIKVGNENHQIFGIYDEIVVPLENKDNIDLINGKLDHSVVYKSLEDLGKYNLTVWDCKGEMIENSIVELRKGVEEINVPAAGVAKLQRII